MVAWVICEVNDVVLVEVDVETDETISAKVVVIVETEIGVEADDVIEAKMVDGAEEAVKANVDATGGVVVTTKYYLKN